MLSESCHPQYDVGDATTYTRCDAAVEFGDTSGKLIKTTVTDAFPDEFFSTGGYRAIDLRYLASVIRGARRYSAAACAEPL